MENGLQYKIQEKLTQILSNETLPSITLICFKVHKLHPALIMRYYLNRLPSDEDYEKIKKISAELKTSLSLDIPVEAELLYSRAPLKIIKELSASEFEILNI